MKKYETLEMEFVLFVEDVVTASNMGDSNDINNDENWTKNY